MNTTLDGYNLCIGSLVFAFSDSDYAIGNHAPFWTFSTLPWTVGTPVSLSIGTSCPPDSTLGVSGLTVTPGNGKLYLSWTAPSAPSATVTGYDVHYTSSSSVTIGAAVGSDPATGWAAVTRSGTATTQEISGLTNKTSYRVRVRAKSSDANGAWLARGDTPRLYGSLSGLTGSTSTDGSTFGGALTLSPAFFAGTLAYAAAVAADVTHVRLTPTPGVNYGNERVNVHKSSGGGSTELSADSPNADIALDRGVTEIRVTVTNKHETEGLQRRYTVTVTRAGTRPTTPNRGGTGTGGGGGGGPSTPAGDNEPSPGSDGEPSTSCPPGDREILRNFYQMTNGEGWDRDENWNSEEPLGEWFGVVTDEDGNVVSLRLADNGLSGDMPTGELLCLTELVELALWDNDDLEGEVPEKLVLAVERAALRYIAETLDVNPQWFENYEDPYDFEDWHEGVTVDDDGRVTELDLTGERVTGEIPENIYELLPRLGGIMITRSSEDGGCALSPESSSAFGLFLLTLVVFTALVRKRVRLNT